MDKIIESSTTSILISLIGKEATEKISNALGGSVIYVPRKIRDGRDDIIKQEFQDMLIEGTTCMNAYKSIAEKHELSPRRVRAIVSS
jgi:hypothetical protein